MGNIVGVIGGISGCWHAAYYTASEWSWRSGAVAWVYLLSPARQHCNWLPLLPVVSWFTAPKCCGVLYRKMADGVMCILGMATMLYIRAVERMYILCMLLLQCATVSV